MSDEASRDASFDEEAEQLEVAERAHALRVQLETTTLAKVLGTWEGRRVIFNVIARGDIYHQREAPPLEPNALQRQTGRKELALEVLGEALQVDPQVYTLMQREAGDFERDLLIRLGLEGEDNA